MNISEANDVNTLLAWLTRTAPPVPDGVDEGAWLLAQDDDAKNAAKALAERARRALHAGMSATDVEAAWERVAVG
jgi:hypothetical protein